MKNLKYYIAIISLTLIATSCDDEIIELTERDSLPSEIALAGLTGMETSLFGVYERAKSLHENNEISLYKQCGTDIVQSGTHMVDVQTGGMYGMMEYLNAFDASSEQLNNIFSGLIESIDRANVVVKFGNNYEPRNADEEAQKNAFIGDAYCLRANAYLEMAERWDRTVFPELVEYVDSINYDVELSDQETILRQVIADTEAAIPYLGSRLENGYVGRPSKDMAYLIMAKAYMWLGEYANAAAATDSLLNLGLQLQPLDYIFGLEGGKGGEENSQELIFSWIFTPTDQDRPQRTVQMYVPLYDRVPGVARTLAQGGRPWSRLSPSPYYWTLFDSDGDGDLSDEPDGRISEWHKFAWTIDDPDAIDETLAGSEYLSEGSIITQDSTYFQSWASNDREARYLEPTITKTWEDGQYGRLGDEAQGFRNVIVYRLAHAYILGAEAHWRNGNEARALELLNAIRTRAYGNSSGNFSSVDLQTIADEHARELGHEGHRWAFLKRNGLLVERVQAYNPVGGPNIKDYHVRWPIPQNFVDQTGISQNEGY